MKKLLLFLLVNIFVLIKSEGQAGLFTPDSVLQYLAATSEPPADWFSPEFDDSGWINDTAAIGFGENLYPVDPAAKSIYARFDFNIANKSVVEALNLFIDYDDGYIAYLNGHEIARVNVDKSVKYPAFDALANRSHEAELIRRYTNPVEGVYLDSTLLDSCLVEGKNIIAVHVLNDSVNGSDMAFIPLLFTSPGNYYNTYSLVSRYKRLIDVDSSSLPLVIINTDEFGMPYPKNLRATAFMGIVDNGIGKYNRTTDTFNVYNGNISIEIRGQSSRDFPKQSYRFELKDSAGNDTNVVLLGMPKDEDWILFGPFADRSQIRNKLMFDLGRQLGHYQPRSKFCELILNGQSVGLYALTETIKGGKNRVNISKLKETDLTGMDVTGGYIFKYDKENSMGRTLVYPDVYDSLPYEQRLYFNTFMKSYDSIFTSNKFINPGFRKYADDTTLVDYIIMSELSKNADSYLFSTYCYKDREDKDNRVKFGPLWDYDLGFGNTHFQQGNLTNGWQWDINGRLGVRRFLQDSAFADFLQERYYSLRESILSNDYIFATIDSMVNYIDQSRERNYQIWPIIDKNPWSNNQTYLVSNYDEEIEYLKNWITDRTNWIDANMVNIFYPLKIYSDIESIAALPKINCEVYPNPFSDRLVLELETEQSMDISIEISNMLGQVYYNNDLGATQGYQEINLYDQRISEMPDGIYLLRVYSDNSLVSTLKIIRK